MAPVDPYLTGLCASVELDGTKIIVRRGDRFTQAALVGGYVALAPVLRALGAQVTYDARARALLIHMSAAPFATPTPITRAVPQVSPGAVFTPLPSPTEKPAVTAKPLPRRTPLPFNAASPRPASKPPMRD